MLQNPWWKQSYGNCQDRENTKLLRRYHLLFVVVIKIWNDKNSYLLSAVEYRLLISGAREHAAGRGRWSGGVGWGGADIKLKSV